MLSKRSCVYLCGTWASMFSPEVTGTVSVQSDWNKYWSWLLSTSANHCLLPASHMQGILVGWQETTHLRGVCGAAWYQPRFCIMLRGFSRFKQIIIAVSCIHTLANKCRVSAAKSTGRLPHFSTLLAFFFLSHSVWSCQLTTQGSEVTGGKVKGGWAAASSRLLLTGC